MSVRLRYKLTLGVEDYGQRTFQAVQEGDCQSALAESLAFNLGSMMGILNNPPSAASMAEAMLFGQDLGVLKLLAKLYRAWDGEEAIEDCIGLSVNVERLCGTDEKDMD